MVTQFEGFPAEGLRFLAELAANNNRDWFEAHKATYQDCLLQPAVTFVAALGERLQTISDGICFDTRANGSGSLMRIYRDTRFSEDKTPYKTNISALFWEGSGKKTELPAFGFQLEADNIGLMAGLFGFPKPLLEAYRRAVVDETTGKALVEAMAQVREAGSYDIFGEHYKRVPSGYPVDHPRADLLRYNGLYAHPPRIMGDILTRPELVETCFKHFQQMAPIQRWLVSMSSSR
jgi:uncharacterized protein (TIGR02453 family)